MINIYSRRNFLERCTLAGVGGGLAALANIPPFVRRALAEGTIGTQNPPKKVIFLWLRFGSDALNLVPPVLDDSYSEQRNSIYIPRFGQTSATDNATGAGLYNTIGDYDDMPGSGTNNKMFDATLYKAIGVPTGGTNRLATDSTYGAFDAAIPSGNGFIAFHPKLKFLAPVFNDGDLAVIHRVAYPSLTRSHFDSQNYWENGVPGDNTSKEGIFYRIMAEAIKADPLGVGQRALTGVSFHSSLPLILRGSQYAMTNLSDPARYSLQGVLNVASPRIQLTNALTSAKGFTFPAKGANRDALEQNFSNLSNTLKEFADISFNATFTDSVATDSDVAYDLFPTTNGNNGGYGIHGSDPAKYVLPAGTYGFIKNVKNAAVVCLQTDAIITGCELGGWDTHNNQVTSATVHTTGGHANSIMQVGWAFYALKRFFTRYGKTGSVGERLSTTVGWDDVVVVAFSEFGRTSRQNTNLGTDHGESGCMYVAGGAVKGGIYCAHNSTPTGTLGANSLWTPGNGTSNSSYTLFGTSGSYLKRAADYRSVFGEIIKKHLGATDNQLANIIEGYGPTPATSVLRTGGAQSDGTNIVGELGIL